MDLSWWSKNRWQNLNHTLRKKQWNNTYFPSLWFSWIYLLPDCRGAVFSTNPRHLSLQPKIEEVYQSHSKSKLLGLRQSRIKCRGPCEDINIVHIAKDYLLYNKVYTNVIYMLVHWSWNTLTILVLKERSSSIENHHKAHEKRIWQINILIPPTKQDNWFVTILCYEQWCEQTKLLFEIVIFSIWTPVDLDKW